MAKRIYGFICDEALQKWDSNTLLATDIDQGAGVASQNVVEFFNQIEVVKDNRSSRFSTYFGGGVTLYGKLGFLTDQKPPNDIGGVETEEGSGAIPADTIDFTQLTANELKKLFNIIEDCLYARSTGTSDLVTTFLNIRFSSNTNYAGYKTGSIQISSNSEGQEAFLQDIKARASDNTVIQASNLKLPEWIQFTFETSVFGDVTFKFWLSRDHFLSNYPLVTVTDVVLPCGADALADPSLLDATNLGAMIKSTNIINNAYVSNLRSVESSGVKVFQVPYFPESYVNISMPFGVVYKGPAPSNELCKKAIRAKLMSTSIDEDIWTTAFPDLFVASKFFLIPYWGNTFIKNNTAIDSGITDWKAFYDAIRNIFPYYNVMELDARIEIILNDATNLIIGVVPDSGNDANKTLKKLHSTYIPVDGSSSAWGNQELKTQVFNQKLTEAIAVAMDNDKLVEHSDLSVVDVNLGTEGVELIRKFIYFSYAHADFYILNKSSWNLEQ